MNSGRDSPLRVVGLLGLVAVSVWISRAAAAGVDSNRLEGLLIPLVFLLVAVSLVYPVIRWTRPGLIRWIFLMLVLALPLIVGVQLFALWVL